MVTSSPSRGSCELVTNVRIDYSRLATTLEVGHHHTTHYKHNITSALGPYLHIQGDKVNAANLRGRTAHSVHVHQSREGSCSRCVPGTRLNHSLVVQRAVASKANTRDIGTVQAETQLMRANPFHSCDCHAVSLVGARTSRICSELGCCNLGPRHLPPRQTMTSTPLKS